MDNKPPEDLQTFLFYIFFLSHLLLLKKSNFPYYIMPILLETMPETFIIFSCNYKLLFSLNVFAISAATAVVVIIATEKKKLISNVGGVDSKTISQGFLRQKNNFCYKYDKRE